jgi:hypothetical protein
MNMKNMAAKQGFQAPGGSSAKQMTSTGSGSRPKSGKFMIESSNPAQTQTIRPKNKIDSRKG